MESHGLGMGIAHHQLGDEGGKTGGEQHGIGVLADGFPLHDAAQRHTHHTRHHIHRMDAPCAEAHGQQGDQRGRIIGLPSGQTVQTGADKANQRHVQEGGCIAAHGEIVGGSLGGGTENPPETGEHLTAIGHKKSRDQEAQAEKTEKDLQELGFGHGAPFLHESLLLLSYATIKP